MSDVQPPIVEAIRRRPGMYLGSTDIFGVVRLLETVLEVPRQPRRLILETGLPGRYCVEALGTGISLEARPGVAWPYLLEVMSQLHTPLDDPPSVTAGERLDVGTGTARFEETARANGGLLVARAVCERLEVTSARGGKLGRITCARGEIVEPLSLKPVSGADLLQIVMTLDPSLLAPPWPQGPLLAESVRDVANRRGVEIELREHSGQPAFVYRAVPRRS
jgi:hypothetical protein